MASRPPDAEARRSLWLALSAFALLVLGSKLLLIAHCGNATPFDDQWEDEADHLLRAWSLGTLGWRDLLAAHFEHRLLTTRAAQLFLVQLNGGIWNPLLEMVFNALVHVATLVLLLCLLGQLCPSRQRLPWLYASTVVFMIPMGWQNTLWGFQLQFYWLILFSAVCLWGLCCSRLFSLPWWLGLLSGLLAELSMASGFLAPAVAAVVLLQRGGAGWLPALLGLQAVVGIVTTPHTLLEPHLMAHTPMQFFRSLLQILEWPFFGWPSLLLNLPMLLFLRGVWRRAPPREDARWFLLALCLWQVGQYLLLAYGRGSSVLSSRYQDIYSLALPVNLLCLLLQGSAATGFWQTAYRRFLQLWLLLALGGLMVQYPVIVDGVAARQATAAANEKAVRHYLEWKPGGGLAPPPVTIDAIGNDAMHEVLDTPATRALLPGNLVPANGLRQPPWVDALLAHLEPLGLLLLLAGSLALALSYCRNQRQAEAG